MAFTKAATSLATGATLALLIAACGGGGGGTSPGTANNGTTDTTPPTVSSTSPAAGAINVAVGSAITVTFSETMDCTTLTAASFTVSDGAAVAGAVTCNSATATFTPAASLTAGATHTATLTTAAKDIAGNAMAASHVWTFTAAAAVPATTVAAGKLAASWQHTCAVLPAGGVACWGYNSDGQLGDGTYSERTVPYTIASLANVTWIATGQHASCAVKADHTVDCWGNGIAGAPVAVQDGFGHAFDRAKSVAVGATHKCLITTSDEVLCWGSNTGGQLGDGGSSSSTVPKTIGIFNSHLYDAAEVVAAGYHTCVRKNSGSVECWGINSGGSIGNSGSDSSIPLPVVAISGATSIATNEMATCVALSDGTVSCWGTFVGLGSDTPTVSTDPVAIPGLSNVVALTGGGGSFCALHSDNRIRCWGYMGTVDKTNVPRLEGIDNVAAVALGSGHTCALQTTGLMDCWGSNTNGQLGVGHKVSINSGPNPPVTTVTSDPFVVTPVTFWH